MSSTTGRINSLLLATFLAIIFFTTTCLVVVTNATSSTCRAPINTGMGGLRKGGVVTTLSASDLEAVVESHLLSMRVGNDEDSSSAGTLNDEDLEFLSESTNMENVLFRRAFRRAFRRIGRAIRRVARAIGRLVGGFLKAFGLKRRSRQIVENSVKNFNGFTGPTPKTLENRREFTGFSTVTTPKIGGVATLRRRRGFGRRFRRFLRRAGRVARRVSRVSRSVARGGFKGIRGIARRGKSILRGLSRKAKQVATTTITKTEPCVACRVDCMKSYGELGTLFSSCKTQYHYYGCQLKAPCFNPLTAGDSEIEGMVGICVVRNGCKLVNSWSKFGVNERTTDKVIGLIRASRQNPE